MPRLRNRRGAMLVLGAVLFVGLMVMAVLAVDFSRVVSQRNEIHTASDAGALGGAVQLVLTPTTTEPVDSAIVYAQRNMISGAPAPTAELGFWNDSTRTFTTPSSEPNAVRVQTQRGTNYLIGSLFNILPATMRRTSIAWANAPVLAAPCVRPWALPYDSLLSRIGISDPSHVLDAGDLVTLQQLSKTARSIVLKLGANNPGNAQPGNFNAVVVPSFWQARTGTYRSPRPQSGASRYRDRISAEVCPDLVGVGDSLDVEPGNMVTPTITGVTDLCGRYGGMSGNACLDTDGSVGILIKVALYGIEFTNRLNGNSDPVVVRAIGGFELDSIETTNSGVHPKSTIFGSFEVFSSDGIVGGGGNSTIVRPILVR